MVALALSSWALNAQTSEEKYLQTKVNTLLKQAGKYDTFTEVNTKGDTIKTYVLNEHSNPNATWKGIDYRPWKEGQNLTVSEKGRRYRSVEYSTGRSLTDGKVKRIVAKETWFRNTFRFLRPLSENLFGPLKIENETTIVI